MLSFLFSLKENNIGLNANITCASWFLSYGCFPLLQVPFIIISTLLHALLFPLSAILNLSVVPSGQKKKKNLIENLPSCLQLFVSQGLLPSDLLLAVPLFSNHNDDHAFGYLFSPFLYFFKYLYSQVQWASYFFRTRYRRLEQKPLFFMSYR